MRIICNTICLNCMFSIFFNYWSNGFFSNKHISLFWNVGTKHWSVNWFYTKPQPIMMVSNLYNSFIYYECRNSFTFVKDLTLTKSLYPSTDSNMTSFLIIKEFQCISVLRRPKPRKYKYKEYITINVSILFLSNNLKLIID